MAEQPPRPPLKRFANIEMDGDPPRDRPPARAPAPARPPAPAPSRARTPEDDLREARALAAELSANARQSIANTRPEARRQERAEQIRSRRMAPPPSAPMPGPEARALRFEIGQPAPQPRPVPRRYEPIEIPANATPGVMTIEVDLSHHTRMRDVDDGLGLYAPRTPARAEAAPPPIDLTPMAARQVKLMAWEAGMPGSGLRILTSDVGGLGRPECDFAFDDDVQPDDVVFHVHGVRLIIDTTSLRHLSGRRITWHDVPGSEGFAIR